MQLSKHFKSEEFQCKCGCGFDSVNLELLEVLEDIRSFFGSPVTITSGCRCEEHNKEVGGAKFSQHIYGNAADIKVKSTLADKVYVYLDTQYPNKYGLGLYKKYPDMLHVDVREEKGRWSK